MCNCKQFPFTPDPPCFDICVANMLNDVSIEELLAIVGLPYEIVKKISQITGKSEFESLDDYKQFLSQDDMIELEDKFRSLNDVQVNYLLKPSREINKVSETLKNYVIGYETSIDLGLQNIDKKNIEPYMDIKKGKL